MAIQTISPKDLLIYLCLRYFKDAKTGESSVTIAKIAELTMISPVTILNSIDRLKDSKFIKCVHRGKRNFYTFLVDIDATSYDFLKQKCSSSEKIKMAAREARVPNKDLNSSGEANLLRYVKTLEKDTISLKKQVSCLTDELNKINRYVSAITGQPYSPLSINDN